MTEEDREWLRRQLHSPAMQCRQCALIARLLDATEDLGADA